MARMRTVEDPIKQPPAGAITLAVARHVASTWPSPEVVAHHLERKQLVHQLVDELSLDVLDWGTTDRDDLSNEVVELVIALGPALVSGAAAIIGAWIMRPKRSGKKKASVAGIAVKRPDGAQLSIDYQKDLTTEDMAGLISTFLAAGSK